MQRAINYLFAFVLFALVASAAQKAYALRFQPGEVLQHNLSVCVSKEDAIEILTAESKNGYEAAAELWGSKDECATVPVIGGQTVGKQVFAIAIRRNGESLVGKVVEILKDGKVIAYFLTTAEVGLKKERDA